MKYLIILLLTASILSGCSSHAEELNEKIFTQIWKVYIQMEFEESFYQKPTITKKNEFISEIAQRAQIPVQVIEEYMKQNHPEKYKRVYLDK